MIPRTPPLRRKGRVTLLFSVLGAALAVSAVAVALVTTGGPAPEDRGKVAPRAGEIGDRGGQAKNSFDAWQAFWVEAREVENYTGLKDMTSLSSLVVEGTIESIESGRVYALDDLEFGGAVKYVLVKVRIDKVLAGTVAAGGETVKLELGPVAYQDDISALVEGLAGNHGVFFLRLKGDGVPEFAIPGDKVEAAEGFYRAVSSQGIFLDDDGEIELGLYFYPERFPANLKGSSFDALVAEVGALGETAAG